MIVVLNDHCVAFIYEVDPTIVIEIFMVIRTAAIIKDDIARKAKESKGLG